MSREARNLAEAKALYAQGHFSSAGIYARKVIRKLADDVEALIILGHLAFRNGDNNQALAYYQLPLKAQIQSEEMQTNLLSIYLAQEAYFNAHELLSSLVVQRPDDMSLQFKLGLNASKIGKMDIAQQALMLCVEHEVFAPQALLNLGHVYKAKGDTDKAAACYHDYIQRDPDNQATGYWSLADLKNYRFCAEDEAAITSAITKSQFSPASQSLFHFALNRIFEQRQEFENAFDALRVANQLMQSQRPFKQQAFQHLINRLCQCQPALEQTRVKQITQTEEITPIFIVGMPRSGTTLSEQILASHSQVEASDELPYLERIALELEMAGGYGNKLAQLSDAEISRYRLQYLSQAKQYLSEDTNTAYLIDKNPNNFIHIGLIKVLFPEAKIINVVRSATDNGLGVFRQHFSRGHDYAYSLDGICHYWQGYLDLMRHWEHCFKGQIYHLCFEALVKAPDEQIPALLAYCDLAFEPACLKFYESKRSVLTPSASQVRQPMNTKAIGQSERYQTFIPNAYKELQAITAKAQALFFNK
ncbi:sulfotransferase [Shewanella sp. Isolate11]|uniref:tetratricopeptide repeat-containing sulfotransferase family protein n=1 Tax=Shewanella sp. Isolate11 TaxID=2908530 RepID=UPI001EFC544C|nr:sulfotransferase [Shewanella sp. Isolate11]MCG9697310.1 sulfotransferase [Shewanella sp. Isolate11]